MSLPFWTGCDGCRRAGSDISDDPDAKKQASTEDITFGGTSPLPSGTLPPTTAIKPGHWFTLRQSIRSNQSDQRGDLTFKTFVRDASSLSASPLSTAVVPSGNIGESLLTCTRPAVLPKGRMKRLDMRLLASADGIGMGKRISTSGTFNSGSSFADSARVDHTVMRGDEYFFVILTTRPERFATFQVADWVRPPIDGEAVSSPPSNYRIVFPRSDGLLALPETMLDWTSTAVLFWDDLSPSELTPQQRQALTDWLHFGGRMIVNGNSTVSELATSELGSLLPIAVDGMVVLDSEAMTQLIDQWSVPNDESKLPVSTLVREQASRVSIGGDLVPDATSIDRTSDLLARRSVGRGEVVMSRFDLTSDWMVGWRSRDSFFNAAALARPGRKYDTSAGILVQQYLLDAGSLQAGAAINTSVRLAGRDSRLAVSATGDELSNPQAGEFTVHPISGLGGWRDDSDVGRLLQSVLREQAGVVIPPVPFVMKSLLIYLTLLVPVNYIVFRLLGRLEWAWLAIPVLALGGAAWIACSVSLDLGLARNHSEVSLLELQPGYKRGHVTRFASIYNSLSGNYQLQFAAPDVAVTPVDSSTKGNLGIAPPIFRYGYTAGPILDDFFVPSNRTRMFHVEQIVDVGGVIELNGDTLRNGTKLKLTDAIAFRKSVNDEMEFASVASLDPGSGRRLQWTAKRPNEFKASITGPFQNIDSMPKESARLIGQLDEPQSGMTIVPETSSQSSTNIVLAHLVHPPQERSRGDTNLVPTRKQRESLLLEGELDPSAVKETVSP